MTAIYIFIPDKGVSPQCAPSILITFINMVLFKPSVAPTGCSSYMYSGQSGLQKLLVVLALLCVPWMLFSKPVYIMQMRKKQALLGANHQQMPTENGDAEGMGNQQQQQPVQGGGTYNISNLYVLYHIKNMAILFRWTWS